MANKTVFQIVKDINDELGFDEITTITDTEVADRISKIVRSVYEELVNNREWEHFKKLSTLTSAGSAATPTNFTIADSVQRVLWFKYNCRTADATKDYYKTLIYKEPEDFLNIINSRDSSSDNIDVVSHSSGIKLLILNNTAPTYFTSFDDGEIICDAYDSDVESYMATNKTQAYIYQESAFTLSDAHEPDLPDKAMSYLISEAKAQSWATIKETVNNREESRARRNRTNLARKNHRVGDGNYKHGSSITGSPLPVTGINYGRK